MQSIAAARRTRLVLQACVAAGRRPNRRNRAERPLGSYLVQVPGVTAGTLERVPQDGRLEDRILLIRRMANTVVVIVDNLLPLPRRGTKAFIH